MNLEKILIGNQIWSPRNLDSSSFRNGDPIPEATSSQAWKKAANAGTPAWCYYENEEVNGDIYGKLYNWFAVTDPRGLAPRGWRVPSNDDWAVLAEYLGYEDKAGVKIKATSGWYKDGNGTNESGFSGLPGGSRDDDGTFKSVGHFAIWWCSDEYDSNLARYRSLFYFTDNLQFLYNYYHKGDGLSVRCVKNEATSGWGEKIVRP